MFDPSSFPDPTPLAHADTSRDVFPRGGAQCEEFIVMDDNVQFHRVRPTKENFKDQDLEQVQWPTRSPDHNLIKAYLSLPRRPPHGNHLKDND
ncbi:hypothetical protein TNCV_1108071 [Trichonephila clavipes]|nr:hypothetical protein TNCV_1108071 [Trichonephila clavipes]